MTSLQVALGFSSSSIGNILGVMKLLTSFLSPMVSSYADNSKLHRRLVVIKTIARSTPLVFMLALYKLDSLSLGMYWILNACISLSSIGITPMQDALFLSTLEDKSTYGKVRLWGALTYGLGNLFVGYLIQTYGNFDPVFLGSIIGLLFSVPMIYWVLPESAGDLKKKSPSHVSLEAIKTILLGSPSRMVFYLICIAIGASMSLVESLLFVAMERSMKGSTPVIAGLSVLVSVLFELPIFHMAPKLLKKYGTKSMIIVASLGWIIRATGYALSEKAWFALVLEIFHGVTYGLFYTAAVEVCVEQCPPGYEATMQSLLDMTYSGIGVGIGTIGGGYMLELLGTTRTFTTFIFVLGLVTVAFYFVFDPPKPGAAGIAEIATVTYAPIDSTSKDIQEEPTPFE